MSEKSRMFVAEWLFDHKPEFVIINSRDSVDFFKSPVRISLKFNGKCYHLSVDLDSTKFEMDIENEFTALCPDKYNESTLLIVDSMNSVEIVENYKM